MNSSELFEKLREQYDRSPYPKIPLEKSPKDNPLSLYSDSLTTSFYLRDKKVMASTEDTLILDVACGSGYTTLVLAEANPKAKIIGIDISQSSLDLAEQRLKHYGFDNVEFKLISLENLSELNLQFDYINALDILYILPDVGLALKSFKEVLKPQGIIRGDLHSYYQRFFYYKAQNVFKMMGLMEDNPGETEAELVRNLFESLNDNCYLKLSTWSKHSEKEMDEEYIIMNYLIQGDKGFLVSDMFAAIEFANLEFISMVNWWQWDVWELFKDPDNLPTLLAFALSEISLEEQLKLCELIHPTHRLFDFWCGHPQTQSSILPFSEWTVSDWQAATIYLHPITQKTKLSEDLSQNHQLPALKVNNYSPSVIKQTLMDRTLATAIFQPLLNSPQSFSSLMQQWLKLRPINLMTLEPTTEEEAWETIKQTLIEQEALGTILISRI